MKRMPSAVLPLWKPQGYDWDSVGEFYRVTLKGPLTTVGQRMQESGCLKGPGKRNQGFLF